MKGIFRLLSSLLVMVSVASVALSQSTGGEGSSGNGGYGGEGNYEAPSSKASAAKALTPTAATRIAKQLTDAAEYCEWTPEEYVVDCLADQYAKIERSLPKGGDYSEVRKVIGGTAKTLQGIARKYSYGAKPVVTKRPPPGKFNTSATRALIPVPKQAQRKAVQSANRAVAEATTLLLRSGEQSAARRAPFQKIASALGDSNKVLLRAV